MEMLNNCSPSVSVPDNSEKLHHLFKKKKNYIGN